MTLLNLSVANNLIHAELYEHSALFKKMFFLLPPAGLFQKLMLYLRFLLICLSGHFDRLYCFSPDLPESLYYFFRCFQRKPVRHCFLFPEMGNIPLFQAYLDCLKSEGMTVPDNCFQFPASEQESSAAQTLADSINTPLIAFGIGGNKQVCLWSVERYSELISILQTVHAFTPVYLGGENDRSNAEFLIEKNGGIFLADTTCSTLRNTIAFLSRCRCYIGNDTGSMHLAAAAGIPCYVIMSAHNTPSEEWIPFGQNNHIFRADMECAGCQKRICPKGNPAPCMEYWQAEEIAKHIAFRL